MNRRSGIVLSAVTVAASFALDAAVVVRRFVFTPAT